MDRSAIAMSLIFIGGLMVAVIGGQDALATEKKEAYVPPGAVKKGLIKEPLHGVKAQIVTVDQYTMPAGWVGGKHYHSGPVYVYVLEGSFTIDEQGKERRSLRRVSCTRNRLGHRCRRGI
jgi:hypothetical protein